jgi:F-type H+-transporting ATPase subunit delta
MLNPRLAFRYAKSLLDLAIERGQLEEVYADMLWLQSVCKSSREFVTFLKSPIIKNDKKAKILEAVTAGKIGLLTAAFNKLLVTKSRESFLPEMITAFINQYKVEKGIRTVHLTTAHPLNDDVRNAIVDQIKKSLGFEKIDLEEKVDEEIIGGFRLQVEDQLIDASVAYDLKAIARQFENNDFIYRIR